MARIRAASGDEASRVSELYYDLHPIEEKESRERGLVLPIRESAFRSFLLVAEEECGLVGFIWANYIKYGSFSYGVIEELYVQPSHRRKGIATALIRTVLDEMAALGAKVVSVSTGRGNIEAQKLYERCEFAAVDDCEFLFTFGPAASEAAQGK